MSIGWLGLLGAGLGTFLTPCVLPLVPVYLSALAGADIRHPELVNRRQLLARALLFSAGFMLVFVLLGMAASSLGGFLLEKRHWLKLAGGLIILLFGLHFVGLMRMSFLERTLRIDDRRAQTRFGSINALIMGLVFAAGWSPCAGPILGSVLAYTASQTADPWRGAFYLFLYGLGFALPLWLVALFAGAALGLLKKLSAQLVRIEKIIGAALVVVGLAMLVDVWAAAPLGPPPETAALAMDEPTLLIFTSENCGVCQRNKAVMDAITQRCDGKKVRVKQIELTTPEGRAEARKHRLVATPTFVFIDARGNEVARLVGEQSEQTLLQALSALRGEPCPGLSPLGDYLFLPQSRSDPSGCRDSSSP
jgi:cytochrome c-type biogenesis protein